MNEYMPVDIESLEGRTYVIGRDGHIYIDSPTISKQHAEIKIINGKIFLRDLDSTNGTFLLRNNKLVFFDKGYVNILQPIVLGGQTHTIQSLLAIAGVFADTYGDDAPTLMMLSNGNRLKSGNKTI